MASSRRSGRAEALVDAALVEALGRFSDRSTLLVAFSGGRDSTVLLDALVRLRGPAQLVAWHVHHGLQPGADRWLAWCEREAARQGVRFGHTRLGAAPLRGENLEAWAREARYAALWAALAQVHGAALLTAHHADDQVETVFMRLARGSGPEALGGMAPAELRLRGWLLRPLLGTGGDLIGACAKGRALQWIDDPMNADETLLRTTLRARLLPALAAVAPGLRGNVLRSAALLRETGQALRAAALADLQSAGLSGDLRALDRRTLAALPPFRRNAAVREWWRLLGLPMPTQARLAQWVAQMLLGGSASASVEVVPLRFRRYRDRMTVERTDVRDWHRDPPPPLAVRWHGEATIELPGWAGCLSVRASDEPGALDTGWLAAQRLGIRSPPAGARLRPCRGGPSRTLKNLYQERGVPPWLRAALPAVFAGERLIFAAGIGMDASESPGEGERVRLYWCPDDPGDPRGAACGSGPAV